MSRNQEIIAILSLIVAIITCIGGWLSLPQIQRIIEVLASNERTPVALAQSTAKIPTTGAVSGTTQLAPTIPPTAIIATTDIRFSADYYLQSGVTYFKNKQYSDAIASLNTCILLDSSRVDCYNVLAMSYRDSGDFDQALRNHNKAISIIPRYDFYFERGVTYHKKALAQHTSEYDKAILDFNTCVQMNPTFSNCINRLGMAYRDIGQFSQALPYHNKAIEISPERGDFYQERGVTYQRMSNNTQANADFQRARDLGYGK